MHRLFNGLAESGIHDVVDIKPVHFAVRLGDRMRKVSRPTVKQEQAGVRHPFDRLAVRQAVSSSPAAAGRGPKHTVHRGATPDLSATECRRFLRSIPVETVGGLRDRALIAIMTYGFARVSAVLGMNVKGVFLTDSRLWLRLHERGGTVQEVPCHHNLETWLRDTLAAAGIGIDRDGPLSRRATATARCRNGGSTRTAPGAGSGGEPGLRGSRITPAITRFGRRASRHILKTRRPGSKSPNTRPATRTRRRRSTMTVATIVFRPTRLRRSGYE